MDQFPYVATREIEKTVAYYPDTKSLFNKIICYISLQNVSQFYNCNT